MKKIEYRLHHSGISLRIAVVSDLHGKSPKKILRILREDPPQMICIPGDISERLDGTDSLSEKNFWELMQGVASLAPTYFSYGNHDLGAAGSQMMKKAYTGYGRKAVSPDTLSRLNSLGITLLDNSFVTRSFGTQTVMIGGLTTGMINPGRVPSVNWLTEFTDEKIPGFRILLSHHPEYYNLYLKTLPIHLIVSGHAHGGQWRFFGQGIYAPGQGFFPKYTRGFYEGRLLVSPGTGDRTMIPRFGNPHSVLYLTIS